jgi:hypothetical protein
MISKGLDTYKVYIIEEKRRERANDAEIWAREFNRGINGL